MQSYHLIFGLLLGWRITLSYGEDSAEYEISPYSHLYNLLRNGGMWQEPPSQYSHQLPYLAGVPTYFNRPRVQQFNHYDHRVPSNIFEVFQSPRQNLYDVNAHSLVLSPYGVFYNPNQFHGYFAPILPHQNLPGFDRGEDDAIDADTDCMRYGRLGTCEYKDWDCEKRGGQAHQYCPDITKQCCLFLYKKCNIVTQGNIIHIENEAHPLSTRYLSSCKYTIEKTSKDICGFRFIFERASLPGILGNCVDVRFKLSGIPNVALQPICGSLSGLEYDVPAKTIDKITLELEVLNSKFVTFKLTVKQLKCNESPKILWPIVGDDQAQGLPAPLPTPSKPKKNETQADSPGGSENPQIVEGTIEEAVIEGAAPEVAVTEEIITQVVVEEGNSTVVSSNPALLSCGFSTVFHPIPKTSPVRISKVEDLLLGDEEMCIGENCPSNLLRNPFLESDVWEVPKQSQSILHEVAGPLLPLDGRITFGMKTKQFENPWQIVIYARGRFHCSGAVVDRTSIITAAHCVNSFRFDPSALKITLGDYDVKSQEDGKNIVGVVKKIIVHEKYSFRKLQNDIAIIKLRDRLTFSHRVSPICLPKTDIVLVGEFVTVTGWGRDHYNRLQAILMKHTAAVLSNKVCNDRWKARSRGKDLIVDSMMCMDPQDGDSCKGDSGGPCIIEYPPGSKKFTLAGVVSFGSASCTDKKLPGVYTRIGSMLPWIHKNLEAQ